MRLDDGAGGVLGHAVGGQARTEAQRQHLGVSRVSGSKSDLPSDLHRVVDGWMDG